MAVLPFASDGTPRSAGFAEALADDIATELGRSRSLRVLARASVAPFAGPPPDLAALARDTGADYALEGRLDLGAAGARVAARLVDTGTGVLAWSARYDRPGDDLFAIRDPLVTEIVGTLSGYHGVIWDEWLERAERARPHDLSAFELLVLAKKPFNTQTEEGIREARALIEQALDLDPDFPLALTFLATTHLIDTTTDGATGPLPGRRWRRPSPTPPPSTPATAACSTCRASSPSAPARSSVAARSRERALATYPNDVPTIRPIASQMAVALGPEAVDEALALMERARALDPLYLPYYWSQRSIPLYFAGRYAEAAGRPAQAAASLAGGAADAGALLGTGRRQRRRPRRGGGAPARRSVVFGRDVARARCLPARRRFGRGLPRGRPRRPACRSARPTPPAWSPRGGCPSARPTGTLRLRWRAKSSRLSLRSRSYRLQRDDRDGFVAFDAHASGLSLSQGIHSRHGARTASPHAGFGVRLRWRPVAPAIEPAP